MYIFICMYICIYMYIYVNIYVLRSLVYLELITDRTLIIPNTLGIICMYIYIYMYVYVYIYIYIYMCILRSLVYLALITDRTLIIPNTLGGDFLEGVDSYKERALWPSFRIIRINPNQSQFKVILSLGCSVISIAFCYLCGYFSLFMTYWL
jgi:hypothetical protein